MKKRKHLEKLILCTGLCFLLTGCAGSGILDEVPRDFSVELQKMQEEKADKTGASAGAFSDTDGGEKQAGKQSEDKLADEQDAEGQESPEQLLGDAYSFLYEDADIYAYSGLSEVKQIWYRDIATILGARAEDVKLSKEGLEQGLGEEDIDEVFQCVLSDHPELFYVDGYSYTRYTRADEVTAIEFSGSYNVDFKTAQAKEAEIKAAADAILAGAPQDGGEYEKVKYVYDTLIRGTDYQLNSPDNQNVYSVFVNHASVCQGYAKAAQYLLNRMGIECTLVLGTVDTGEGHAWNLVKIDGSYYYMDPTWGDASYQMSESAASQVSLPEVNYDYLNVTTAELLRTHVIGGYIPMPECVATEANFYVREGALFSTYDREQMAALFDNALSDGKKDVTVKCTDAGCYSEVLRNLIDEQDIFTYLGNAGDSIAYAPNDKQLSVTFWVTNE